MNYKSKLSKWLTVSSGLISFMCIFIAVVSRIIYVLYFTYLSGDKIMIASMSRNLLRGNGLSTPGYFVSNIENIINNPAPLWPPGYPLLLAGFLKLFHNDLFWASTTIDLIASVALIFIIRNCCRMLDFKNFAVNFATITVGSFSYPFISASQPTDLVTITLLFLGFSLTIKLFKDDNIKTSQLIITAFLLTLPAFFRYSYHLAILLVPLAVLFICYLQKNVLLFKKARLLLFGCLSFLGISMFVQFLISGSVFHILPTEKGLYLTYLIHWAPFIPASFISSNFLFTKFLAGLFNYPVFYSILEILNLAGCTTIIYIFLLLIYKYRIFNHLTPFRWFVFIGGVMSAGIILLLAYVTITNKEQVFHGVPWNYIQEPRYFAFVSIYIQICFIGWCFSGKKIPFSNLFLMITKYLLVFFLSLEIIHSLYFNFSLTYKYKQYKKEHYWETNIQFIEKTILDLIKNNSDKEIIVAACTFPTAPNLASYYGQKGVLDSKTLNRTLPKVKKPGLLLLHLTDDELPLFTEFFSKTKAVLYVQNEYDKFYLLKLYPSAD